MAERTEARQGFRSTTLLLLMLAGALMIVPVMLSAGALAAFAAGPGTAFGQNFLLAFAGSSLPEEIARFAVLWVALRGARALRPLDGLVYGAIVSLGFSLSENLLYGLTLGLNMALLKLALATPIHLALGVLMGGLLVLARHGGSGAGTILALTIPVLLHGLYDLSVLSALGQNEAGGDVARLVPPVLCYALVIGAAAAAGWRVRVIARAALAVGRGGI